MSKPSFQTILSQSAKAGKKCLAVLVDPDKISEPLIQALQQRLKTGGIDFVFVGGSLISSGDLNETVKQVKAFSPVPVVIFPGAAFHISEHADAILFLSLVSGRNPEFLIGQQVLAAPRIKASSLEVCPTGYILVDGGASTSVSYVSGTLPVPHDKPDIAAVTALTAEMMGMNLVFMDAGSGARRTVSPAMVKAVREAVDCPIIVGGGFNSSESIEAVYAAGADLVVIGSMFESNPEKMDGLIQSLQKKNELISNIN